MAPSLPRLRRSAPTAYSRGDTAEAEPAVPGWRMAVDDLFPPNRP